MLVTNLLTVHYRFQVAKAAKKEQHVAVCVVKVLVKQQQQQPAPVKPGQTHDKSAAGATASGRAGDVPPAKRVRTQQQGSILSFLASPGAARQGGGGAAGGSSCGGSGSGSGSGGVESEEALLKGGAVPWYLLVQRPAQGLLAGLWECPGEILRAGWESRSSGGLG